VMKLPRRKFLHLAAGAVALPAVSRVAKAQAYPTRPIRLVVPFPPGGAYDAVGRPWADKMKTLLGSVIVENIGGGGSSLGAAAVARARPDGYTLLMGGSIPHVTESILKARPLYDPIKDLEPISNIAVTAFAIAVHPSLPAQTLKEFVDHAKANPGKLSYGSPGVGTLPHLLAELFKSLAHTPDITHVPYRGGGPAIADLIGGQVAMISLSMTGQMLEYHRSKKLRVLAVTSAARLNAAPELATVGEMGFPSLKAPQFIGLLAPARTPSAIVEQIARATRTALAEPAYQQFLIDGCFEPDVDSNSSKFRSSLEEDVARWTPVVKALGLKID
jgi:tripartite-type tricarboxylate transporter receptor subunit TctC